MPVASITNTQLIPILSPVLTLILMALARYAYRELKKVISSSSDVVRDEMKKANAAVLTEVKEAKGQLEQVITEQAEHRSKLRFLDEHRQEHAVAIARLQGAQEERGRMAEAASAAAGLLAQKTEQESD